MNMTTSKLATILMSVILALVLAPAALLAADAPKGGGNDDAAIQKRLRERYPQIQKLKTAGTIGETDEGYVDFVDKKDPKAADLVKDENADRKAAYKLIADKEGVDVDVVAKRAGKRNFERAKAGEWLKEGGKWKKK
jgi:uncharacterized protein YdbL (DUF1318 family)